MRQPILIFIVLILFCCTSNLSAQKVHHGSLLLQYDSPADPKIWEQALPIGNGRLGAMIYGIPDKEELQLNEETIWGGGPYRNDNPKAGANLKNIQQLVFEGKSQEADKLINETFFTKTHGMPYQTAGSVLLNFPNHTAYQNYYRELDIEHAKATTRYDVNGITYTREVISSFEDDVILMRITSSKKGALSFDLSYKNPSQHKVIAKDNMLVLEGRGGDHEGIKGEVIYNTLSSIKNIDGNVDVEDSKITVKDATSVVIYISIGTNRNINHNRCRIFNCNF